MDIGIRLKKLLAEHGLDRHGIIQRIAADLDVDRHTIAKLYSNRSPTVSLALMGRLCTWLLSHGVPADELPGLLFSTGRAPLWEAIARQQEEVTLFLGEYLSARQPSLASRWIASSDAVVAARVVQQVSMGGSQGAPGPRIKLAHVPFRYSPADPVAYQQLLTEDITRTGEIFAQLKDRGSAGSTIIIGSQRVNYLLEHFVADLFGCRPFVNASSQSAVPFFSVYRETDQHTPSCFGGPKHPFRRQDSHMPGIHYVNAQGHWETCPWVQDRQDAAIVITQREHRRKCITLAAFGFSGRATEAVGEQLVLREHLFWPPATELKTKDVGIYICRFQYPPEKQANPSSASTEAVTSRCEVIPLSERTVKRFTTRS